MAKHRSRLGRDTDRLAPRCAEGYRLPHSDRDFEAFEKHLGLRVVKYDP